MAKHKIGQFELIDHGIDGSQYFQGCGTAFTSYDHVTTGCGDTPAEAFDDLMEMVAQYATPNGLPTTVVVDGEDRVNGAAYDDFDMEGLEKRILRDAGVETETMPDKPSAHEKMLEANGYDGEFEFDEDEPDRDDFETDDAYDDAHAAWECRAEEAEEAWEEEKDSCGEECDNYYYMSLRWNAESPDRPAWDADEEDEEDEDE